MSDASEFEAQRNLVETIYSAFSRADFKAIRRSFDDSIQLRLVRLSEIDLVISGLDNAISYLESQRGRWTDCELVVREFLHSGQLGACNGMMIAYPIGGGAPTVREFAHEWTFGQGLILAFTDLTQHLSGSTRPDEGMG